MEKVAWEISNVKSYIKGSHVTFSTIRNSTCENSHVKFHTSNFTCDK